MFSLILKLGILHEMVDYIFQNRDFGRLKYIFIMCVKGIYNLSKVFTALAGFGLCAAVAYV